jgi:hypothetical protein
VTELIANKMNAWPGVFCVRGGKRVEKDETGTSIYIWGKKGFAGISIIWSVNR